MELNIYAGTKNLIPFKSSGKKIVLVIVIVLVLLKYPVFEQLKKS